MNTHCVRQTDPQSQTDRQTTW